MLADEVNMAGELMDANKMKRAHSAMADEGEAMSSQEWKRRKKLVNEDMRQEAHQDWLRMERRRLHNTVPNSLWIIDGSAYTECWECIKCLDTMPIIDEECATCGEPSPALKRERIEMNTAKLGTTFGQYVEIFPGEPSCLNALNLELGQILTEELEIYNLHVIEILNVQSRVRRPLNHKTDILGDYMDRTAHHVPLLRSIPAFAWVRQHSSG
jgi:hypothetical protein